MRLLCPPGRVNWPSRSSWSLAAVGDGHSPRSWSILAGEVGILAVTENDHHHVQQLSSILQCPERFTLVQGTHSASSYYNEESKADNLTVTQCQGRTVCFGICCSSWPCNHCQDAVYFLGAHPQGWQ